MRRFLAVTPAFFCILLAPAMAAPPTPNIAGRWNLTAWSDLRLKEDNVHAWINFAPNGTLELYDDCFEYSGHYTQASKSLTISDLKKISGGCAITGNDAHSIVAKYFAIEIAAEGGVNVAGGTLAISNMRGEGFLFQSDKPVQSVASPNAASVGQKEIKVPYSDIYKFISLDEITGQQSSHNGPYHMACTVGANFKLTDCVTDPAAAWVFAKGFNVKVRVGPEVRAKYPVGSRIGFDLESE